MAFAPTLQQIFKIIFNDSIDAVRVDVVQSVGGGGGGGGIQYTEGDIDATITGTAALAEGPSNTLSVLQMNASGNLKVYLENATVAVTQSGSWDLANITGTITLPTGASTEASLAKLPLVQGSTTSGQSGPLAQGAVTTAAPSYTTAQTSPLSLTTSGALRVDGSSFSQPVTIAAQASSIAKAEDVASANADVGVGAMAVQKAIPANTATSDGDYEFLQMSAGRLWVSAIIDSALPAGTNNIGDVDVLSIIPGVAATNLGKAEDAAHTSGDVGVMTLAVRRDTPTALAADNDYMPLITDSLGRLWTQTLLVSNSGVDVGDVTINNAAGAAAVNIQDGGNSLTVDNGGTFLVQATIAAGATTIGKAEDILSADADVGVPAMAVRKATPANTSGTDGDYEFLQMSAGRLWTSTILEAGTAAIGKLAANSGIDIGDVDVTSIVPGVAATNLGKAEDSIAGSGDVGVMALAVRADIAATTAANGDYVPLLTDAVGALYISLSATEKASTSTLSNVAASTSNVTLLALNTARRAAVFYNDSTSICYLKFGTTASATSYTFQMAAASTVILNNDPIYSGLVAGIWISAIGTMRVTEIT